MILIFLGAPGVGKGTQAKKLSREYGIPQISTGDIFRDVIKRETELGKKAKKYVKSGKLVPDELVLEIVEQRFQEDDCKDGFILDGFPRTEPQAEALDEFFHEHGLELHAVIKFKLPKEKIIERLVNRRGCSKCGKIYNLLTHPPKIENVCDKCGGELYQRDDDAKEVIEKRIEVYEEKTYSLINYYAEEGLLEVIDASGSPDDVYEKLKAVL
jgi:adenylate kinase